MSFVEGLPTFAGLNKKTVTVNANLDFTSGEVKAVTITLASNIFVLTASISNSDSANVATRLVGIDGNVIKIELAALNGTPQDVDYTYVIHYIERS